MNRFSKIISKAGDVVQQASQEVQRMRQDAKQPQQQQQQQQQQYQQNQQTQCPQGQYQQSQYPQSQYQQPQYQQAQYPQTQYHQTQFQQPGQAPQHQYQPPNSAQPGQYGQPQTQQTTQSPYPQSPTSVPSPSSNYGGSYAPGHYQQPVQTPGNQAGSPAHQHNPYQNQTPSQSATPYSGQHVQQYQQPPQPSPPAAQGPYPQQPQQPHQVTTSPQYSDYQNQIRETEQRLGNLSLQQTQPAPQQTPNYAVQTQVPSPAYSTQQPYPLQTWQSTSPASPSSSTEGQQQQQQQQGYNSPAAPHVPSQLYQATASLPTPASQVPAYQTPPHQVPPYQAPASQARPQTTHQAGQSQIPPQAAANSRSLPPKTSTPHISGITPLVECAGEPITWKMDWLCHPDVPNFPVCGRCYVDYIYDSEFRNSFRKTNYADGQPMKCLFGTARVKDRLWPQTLSSRRLDSLLEFMKKRAEIPNCTKEALLQNESWHTTAHIQGSTFCRACFEDTIMASEFGQYFKLEQVPGQCYCDMSMWYGKRIFDLHANAGDWKGFAEKMTVRVQLPPCPKQNVVQANDRAWYASRKGPEGLNICVACYYDYFHGTEDQQNMKQMPPSVTNVRCALSYLNLLLPAQEAVGKKNRQIFWDGVREVDDHPHCDPKGTLGTDWYTTHNDPAEFAICGACYGGIVKSCGGQEFFKRHRTVTRNDKWLCDFNLASPRALQYLQQYSESIAKGSPQSLAEYVKKYGSVPICNRRNPELGNGRRFWGWGVLAICEECYLSVAQGTNLEPHFYLKGEKSAENRMCDLYSARMRNAYAQACKTNDLNGLLAIGKHRHEIWSKTMLVCDRILAQHKMNAERAMTLAMAGTMLHAAGALTEVSVGHTHTVGSSYAGYGFDNVQEMQGAALSNQSQHLAMSTNLTGSTMMQHVALLEKQWKEVE